MTTSPGDAGGERSRRATRPDPTPCRQVAVNHFSPRLAGGKVPRRHLRILIPYVGEWYYELTSKPLPSTLGKGITTSESLPGKVPRPPFRVLPLSSTRQKGRLDTDDAKSALGKKPVNTLPRERYHDLRIRKIPRPSNSDPNSYTLGDKVPRPHLRIPPLPYRPPPHPWGYKGTKIQELDSGGEEAFQLKEERRRKERNSQE